MILVAIAAAGALSVVAALWLLPASFRRSPHLRPNYRGRSVIGTAGIVLVMPLGAGLAGALFTSGENADIAWSMAGVGAVMAGLGYWDDVYGDRRTGGFAGHVREFFRGHVTTGLVKAVGGGVMGIAAAWVVGRRGVWVIVGGAIVALSANLVNLLDLRPGRALKVWLPCAASLAVVAASPDVDRVLAALGAGAAVFGVEELRERVMLGDTGAGLLGGVIGIAAVATFGTTASLVVLGALIVLTAASEIVSFTRVIEAVPPLRWADRLGRRSD